MRSKTPAFRWMTLLVASGLAMIAAPVLGQDADAPTQKEQESQADPFALPAADLPAAKALDAWVEAFQRITQFQPTSRKEAEDFQKRGFPAGEKAARMVIELKKDAKDEIRRQAELFLVVMKMQRLPDLSQKERGALVNDIVGFVRSSGEPGNQEIGLSMQLVQVLEAVDSPEAAAGAAEKIADAMGDTPLPGDERKVRDLFDSTVRRLRLPGSEMKLTGVRMDGSEFDLASLKGKVVLIDFWATWCGPCIAEMPNVLEHYKTLHDKGFEVIGVSLDRDRDALEAFIKDREVPWTILHDKENPGANDATDYYGIAAIPTMILVGRDGKVLSTSARGAELTELLSKQFPSEK